MDNYRLLKDKIDTLLSSTKLASLKKDFSLISSTYRKQNIGSNIVVKNDAEVYAYLSTRMCATTTIVFDVLNRIDSVVDFDINTALDIGSGTGAALWAMDNLFPSASVTALELQNCMVKYSKILSESLSLDVSYVEGNILSKTTCDKLPSVDLVIESFMLNELSDSDRLKAVDTICDKTNDYVVLIEPGTPKSYERMMKIRDYVLSKGFSLILPCPHSNPCPLNNDYCNFSVRVERSSVERQVKGGTLSFEDEKYFYLDFRKNSNTNLTTKSIVIRHPVYRKNCVDIKLCDKANGIVTKTITKSDKSNYKYVKKLSHGDIVDIDL
ncbi:MAG: methyltransferase domain-containing protein [Clostridia bacterium]|nr:methyltransferase domain-containing protein [Clostridia bacterium]